MKISALALLKMVMHARSGGHLEVMGLMLGKIDGSTMVVMDTFALPVEGTETRVNAQAAAYEYMSTYIESAKQVGENINFSTVTSIYKLSSNFEQNCGYRFSWIRVCKMHVLC